MQHFFAEIIPYGPSVLFGILGSFGALLHRQQRKMPGLFDVCRAGGMGMVVAIGAGALSFHLEWEAPMRTLAAIVGGMGAEALFGAVGKRLARYVEEWKP